MKMKLECQECDKVFLRSTKTVFPKCPRCKSEDLFPTKIYLSQRMLMHLQAG